MKDFANLAEAMAFAEHHAQEGLKTFPFDAIYQTTISQIQEIKVALARTGNLDDLPTGCINLGIMAAKELGNDEAEFAHALQVIQWNVNAATGKR